MLLSIGELLLLPVAVFGVLRLRRYTNMPLHLRKVKKWDYSCRYKWFLFPLQNPENGASEHYADNQQW